MECTKNINCKHCGLKYDQGICYKFNNSLKKDKRSESRTDQAYSKDEIVSTVFPMWKNKVFLHAYSVKVKNKQTISWLLLECRSVRFFLY